MITTFCIDELSNILHLDTKTIMSLIISKELKAAKVSGKYIVSLADLQDFFTRCGGGCLYIKNDKRIYGNVKISPTAIIQDFATIDARGGDVITIGDCSIVCEYSRIVSHGGIVSIGNNVSIQVYCVIYGHGGLSIGDNTMIAAQTLIIPANHIYTDHSLPMCQQGETRHGIKIGSDVWIGAGCKILDGITIEDGSVIGAGSVVTKSIPTGAVAAGVPAKIIKYR